jgi:uncharacterized delta-60 repeat protein
MRRGLRTPIARPSGALLWLLLLVVAIDLAAPVLAASAPIALDPGFGRGGVVSAGSAIPDYREAAALAIAPNDEILVAGENSSPSGGAALVRYRPDGTLDPVFSGGAGYVHLPGVDGIDALAVDEGGDALLLSQRTTISRIASNSEIDESFGDHGTVRISQLDPRFASLHFWSLAVLPDNSVLAAGIRFGSPRMVVVRLLPAGGLDMSFGEGGLVTLGFGRARQSGAFQMAVQPDGDIVLGGYADGAPALARLLPDGAPDSSFGHNGRPIAPRWRPGKATGLAILPGGGILLAGTGRTLGDSGVGILLLRYGRQGRLDPGFGSAESPVGPTGRGAEPIAVLPAGRRILAITRGRGPAIHAYRPDGRAAQSLMQVPGVPRNRFFGTTAALQHGKLVLAWTPKHRPGAGAIQLERFAVR